MPASAFQKIKASHELDRCGNPAGGRTRAIGLEVRWHSGKSEQLNGAIPVGLIQAVCNRLAFLQSTPAACCRYYRAINDLNSALVHLTANDEPGAVS